MANEHAVLLEVCQLGLEAIAGTLVPATYKWSGKALLKFLDKLHEGDYATAEAGGAVEDIWPASTGSELTLVDTDFSVELGIWLLNMGVKAVVGPATSFPFTLPTLVTPNAISTFTWEYKFGNQEYEFGYGFAKKIGIHGDSESNDGILQGNAVIEGRKSAPSTMTASLAQLASREPLSVLGGTFKLDALGTAFGTASALAGTLRAFAVNLDPTGWAAGKYVDGRTDKDFALAEGGGVGYKIKGEVRVSMTAAMVTEIANARAGTGRIMEIALAGTSSRAFKIQLPIFYHPDEINVDQEANGMRLVTLPWTAKYSRTTTSQGPQFSLTSSASTTVT